MSRTIAAAVIAMLSACGSAENSRVTALTIDRPLDHWEREGFVELVPPIRLPSSSDRVEQVTIWAKLPDQGVIETRYLADQQRHTLVFPPGSVLDRVEWTGHDDERGVIDVRGTRIDEHGNQLFHTFRRNGEGATAPLFGFEWPRGDSAVQREATDKLITRLGEVAPGSMMSPARRKRYLASIRSKNGCAGCHLLERQDNAVEHEWGLVNRGTDGSGFFTPETLLRDDALLESYGEHDLNLDDPLVAITCAGRPVDPEGGRPSCPTGLPRARLDWAKGISTDDPRVKRVCRAQLWLFDRLSDAGKNAFKAAVARCSEKTGPGSEPG